MRHFRLLLMTTLCTAQALAGAANSQAQSLPTATKKAEISAWGGYMPTNQDFGPSTRKGGAGGADFTLFPHLFIDPSVELRFDLSSAQTVSEHAFLFGPRAQKQLLHGRIDAYVNFLFGRGTVTYAASVPSSAPKNSGVAYSLGGGVDLELTRHISLKADVQQQEWHPGANPILKPQGSYTLSPRTVLLGASYNFQFSGLRKQRRLE